MRLIWKKLNSRVRYQVYLRVLPVVVLAVLLVGGFGWDLYMQQATESAVKLQKQELESFLTTLRYRAGMMAMSVESRKTEFMAHAAGTELESQPVCGRSWVADLLQSSLVAGVVLIGNNQQDGELRPAFCMVDSLSGETTQGVIEAWGIEQQRMFESCKGVAGEGLFHLRSAPAFVTSDPWHSVLFFKPFLVPGTDPMSEMTALLPVIIRGEYGLSGDLGQEIPQEVWTGKQCERDDVHIIFFMDLKSLFHDFHQSRWLCILDDEGRVLASSLEDLSPGMLLADQPRKEEGVLATVAGHELVSCLDSDQNFRHALLGNRFQPWLVTAARSKILPVAVMSARPATRLRELTVAYIAAVLGVVCLALGLAVLGVTRVMGGISLRITMLMDNLEAVAKGDYSRRMVVAKQDEVDGLAGFFNLMAVSLDEAHRQVKDKTARLRSALENLRVLDKAKDDFLVLISHEVRTPLTAIKGGASCLKRASNKAGPAERELLARMNVDEIVDIIESSSDRLTGFMNDAITMTAIQSSDGKLDLQTIPVGSLLEMGMCGIRERAAQKNITVVNSLADQTQWHVICDPRLLKIAFEKIFDNAVTHNFEGGEVRISEGELVPHQGRAGDLARREDIRRRVDNPSFSEWEDREVCWRLIQVFNTGPVIPEVRQNALFGKFELVERIENHQQGCGLSLPIAQAAIQMHGGRIFLHSASVAGNSFFILLPTINVDIGVNGVNGARGATRAGGRRSRYQQTEGLRGVPGDEEIDLMGHPAGLEIELEDQGAPTASSVDEPGRGVDDSGCAHDEEEVTIGGLTS